jgi:Domain of unknown function (DUF222)/HNH endonuclease
VRKALDLDTLSGGEHLAALKEIALRMRHDYAQMLDTIAELEHAQTAQFAGYADLSALIAEFLNITRHDAKRMVSQSELVSESVTPIGYTAPAKLPKVREALHDGALDAKHVDAIVRVVAEVPNWASYEHRDLVETTLTDTARVCNPRVVTEHGRVLLQHINQDSANPDLEPEQAEPKNTFHYARTRNGGIKFRGQLDAETGDELEAMLHATAAPQKQPDGSPDPRSEAERHGDGLADIIHLAAKSDGLPKHGGSKPHLNVHLDLNTLTDAVATATLDSGTPLCPSAARRLACDADLIPIVLNGDSVPLDVGRTRRLVKPAQRKALIARDRGCAYPGCTHTPRWCDAHHVTHWADGGKTDLDNMVLLCRRHHRVLHHSAWEIQFINGIPYFIPPAWLDPQRTPVRNVLHHPRQ